MQHQQPGDTTTKKAQSKPVEKTKNKKIIINIKITIYN